MSVIAVMMPPPIPTAAAPMAPMPPPMPSLPSCHPRCPNCGLEQSPTPAHSPLSLLSASSPPPAPSGTDETDAVAALEAARRRITELEAAVRLLNQKAAAAVDRWADYEDEIDHLRASFRQQREADEMPQLQRQMQASAAAAPQPPPPHKATTSSRSSFLASTLSASRLSALLTPRRSFVAAAAAAAAAVTDATTPQTPATPRHQSFSPPPLPPSSPSRPIRQEEHPPAMPPSPSPSAEDLLEALTREQTLRQAAEGRLSATSREVEELSAALFEQANEMVAGERKARAKLEERVEVLERRDRDKRRRLERLESAMARVDKTRKLLAGG